MDGGRGFGVGGCERDVASRLRVLDRDEDAEVFAAFDACKRTRRQQRPGL